MLLLLLLGSPFRLLAQILCLHSNIIVSQDYQAFATQMASDARSRARAIQERAVPASAITNPLTYLHCLLLELRIVGIVGEWRLELSVLRLYLGELRLYGVLRLKLSVLDLQRRGGLDLDVGQIY